MIFQNEPIHMVKYEETIQNQGKVKRPRERPTKQGNHKNPGREADHQTQIIFQKNTKLFKIEAMYFNPNTDL